MNGVLCDVRLGVAFNGAAVGSKGAIFTGSVGRSILARRRQPVERAMPASVCPVARAVTKRDTVRHPTHRLPTYCQHTENGPLLRSNFGTICRPKEHDGDQDRRRTVR